MPLENLRFNAGETSKDDSERGQLSPGALAAFGDAYVDDAPGAVHRKYASVHGTSRRCCRISPDGWCCAR